MTRTIAAVLALATTAVAAGCGSPADDRQTAPHQVPTIAPSMPSTASDPQATAALRTFDGRDADHDGYVSSAENAAASDNVFDAVDKDGNGEISPLELDIARTALNLPLDPPSAVLIIRADQDQDAQLTLAEWIAQEGRDFRAADTNGDGRLSRDEWNRRPMMLEPAGTGVKPLPTPGSPATDHASDAGASETPAERK